MGDMKPQVGLSQLSGVALSDARLGDALGLCIPYSILGTTRRGKLSQALGEWEEGRQHGADFGDGSVCQCLLKRRGKKVIKTERI
jgi:hypothetical protein